jgi:zinc protease
MLTLPRVIARMVLAGLVFLAAAIPAGLGAQDGPDRSRPPATGPAPSLDLPPVAKHRLSNGLPVWIVGMHEVPVVHVMMIVRAGAAMDPEGRFGTASFTAAMLDEGAGTRDALELADAIEMLGATLTTGSAYDVSTVELHALAETLEDALPLMADVVRRPTFAAEELERLRAERLTTLLQMRDNPAQLATAAFNRLLYGASHRYGTSIIGTEAANRALTVEDLRAFHAAYYRPSNAHLLVVGDVTGDAVLPLLERTFGDWAETGRPPAAPAPPTMDRPASRAIYLIDKPGAPQSQIRFGTIGVARSTDDYHAIEVANTMLGGSFSSRLNMNLRERNGYSYGAGSSFAMRLGAGPFVAQSAVQSDKTLEALLEFVNELAGMAAQPPDDELTRVRNFEALGFPRGFETTTAMANRLAELVTYDLPESFFEEYVSRVQAVTAADVQRIAEQYMDPDRMIVVVVGDLASIEGPVRQAGLGPVTIVTADEVLQ